MYTQEKSKKRLDEISRKWQLISDDDIPLISD